MWNRDVHDGQSPVADLGRARTDVWLVVAGEADRLQIIIIIIIMK